MNRNMEKSLEACIESVLRWARVAEGEAPDVAKQLIAEHRIGLSFAIRRELAWSAVWMIVAAIMGMLGYVERLNSQDSSRFEWLLFWRTMSIVFGAIGLGVLSCAYETLAKMVQLDNAPKAWLVREIAELVNPTPEQE